MVKGLALFRDRFRDHTDKYILIGGAACDLVMDAAGAPFRATKDLDIVLCVEALDGAFVKTFWRFVEDGQYQVHEKSTDEKQFYRFHKPADNAFPAMLELFARRPDVLQSNDVGHLTPLPVDEDVSSLSAILMDDNYYHFIRSGKQEVEGVSVIGATHLIPLKALAWLDLTARAGRGEPVDSKTIKKHKNDVFRLYQILDPATDPRAPAVVKDHLGEFLKRMETEDIDLKSLGIDADKRQILDELKQIYRIT